jgi:hypothetical protein
MLRVVMVQRERDGVHAAEFDLEQPPGLHVEAGGRATG